MKIKIAIITILLSTNVVFGQTNDLPISVSYFGNYFIQPGLKVGTALELKELGNEEKIRELYVSPQIGYFIQPNINSGLVVNADIGYKMQKAIKARYSTFSVGLGYMNETVVLSVVHNLGTGEIKSREKENNSYFLPTINYEFGSGLTPNLGWFGKVSGGMKLAPTNPSEFVVFGEVGVTFTFK